MRIAFVRSVGTLAERMPQQACDSMQGNVQLRGLQVLVVDDNADARELAVLVLSSAGARALAVSSVEDALEQLELRRWDVVVTDISMPGDSGFDLLEAVRGAGLRTPMIAHTALAGAGRQHEFRTMGFAAVVPKPFEMEQMIDAVYHAVRTGTDSRSERQHSAPLIVATDSTSPVA